MSKRTKHLTGGLVATAAAAAAVLATTVPAHAVFTQYTPTKAGGAAVTFTGNGVSFTDIDAGQTLTCSTFDLTGTVTNNGTARAFGAEAGQLGSLSSSGCTNLIAGATDVIPSGTWKVKINAAESGTLSSATLYDINANIKAAGCKFDVGGSVAGTFDDGVNQRFTPNSGASGLTITSTPMGGPGYGTPNGGTCATLDVQLGDTISVGGYWTTSGLSITNS